MPYAQVNGIDLYYDVAGSGEPLVLVHGSWADHSIWKELVPALTQSFRVVTYDRRGHSHSERPTSLGSRREDEDDLAALIQTLDAAPAHVVGNSFGGLIALGITARRPSLVRSLSAHEPPLFPILADDHDSRPMMQEFYDRAGSCLEQLETGNTVEGARQFMEEIALGPGSWELLPEEDRNTFIHNAPTWVDELRDPDWATVRLSDLANNPCPVLLTQGDASPDIFSQVTTKLDQTLVDAEVKTIPGAGHVPHRTHPSDYAEILTAFIHRAHA